jgi:serine/threonine protein phosphatase PrpC
VQPHGQVLEVGRGDVLLICTKGLHTAVDPAIIEETLRRTLDLLDLEKACRVLVELAEAAGAQHNITVMLARVEIR